MFAHLDQTIAWMLTYLLHSTLLLGLAWLVSKPLARWSVAAAEAVWKLALVGALLTASLQLAAGWEPVAGRWRLADLDIVTLNESREPDLVSARAEVNPAPAVGVGDRGIPSDVTPGPGVEPILPSLPALVLGLWALGTMFLLAAHVASYLRLRRRLRPRPEVIGGSLFSQLGRLAVETGLDEEVRLTCSSRVPVPLALGLRRSEICVPPRALVGLTDEQREGMLAHELAHLVRRDPLWLVVAQAISCVLFFQPLNWIARRRLREISEMLSDEWAVSRTGRPLSLAGCLAEVAGWAVAGRPLPVPGMADRPSNLARRIRRLLDENRSPERPLRRWWLAASMVVLVIAVAAAAPAVSASRQESPGVSGEPAVAAAPAEPEELAEPQDPEPAEWVEEVEEESAEPEEEAETEDLDVDLDLDLDPEIELALDMAAVALDVDLDVDATVDLALASMDTALGSLGVDLEGLASQEHSSLTPEQQKELETEIERATERIEQTLEPRMEQLSRELSEKMSRLHANSGEMQRLQAEMEKLAERMRPSEEEMARLQAEIEKLHEGREGRRLSAEERREMARRAREMAERVRPTEEQRRQMRQLAEEMRKHQREMTERFRAENIEEVIKAQREMREEIAREMQAVREELRRVREKQRLRMQEERREQRQEIRKEREKEKEPEVKPPGTV